MVHHQLLKLFLAILLVMIPEKTLQLFLSKSSLSIINSLIGKLFTVSTIAKRAKGLAFSYGN